MKFIGVRDFRTKSSSIWKQLKKEGEMIITSNGKPMAILSSVSEDNVEESLASFRRARSMNAVASLQKKSVEMSKDRMTLEEINEEITKVRKSRKS